MPIDPGAKMGMVGWVVGAGFGGLVVYMALVLGRGRKG